MRCTSSKLRKYLSGPTGPAPSWSELHRARLARLASAARRARPTAVHPSQTASGRVSPLRTTVAAETRGGNADAEAEEEEKGEEG